MQVDGVGAFVRVLLPIQLTGGYRLTLGTWLAVNPSLMQGIWERWPTSAYASLRLDGYLANGIPPWGDAVLGAPASAVVSDPEILPGIVASPHPELAGLLSESWPHEAILAAYASL